MVNRQGYHNNQTINYLAEEHSMVSQNYENR